MTTATQAIRHELAISDGLVLLDPSTGAPRQFVDPSSPDRQFLLDDSVRWHSVEHQWGSGHLITDHGSSRWNTPNTLQDTGGTITGHYSNIAGLELTITRHGGSTFNERYAFTNTGTTVVTISSLGIQTPFSDHYLGARSSLAHSVHTHLFTAGSWAWALAEPMSAEGRLLGLVLRSGQLWGYSIESRNQNTISNARGHIVLQATDNARNPTAFGGQPLIVLEPGTQHVIEWELGWYDSREAFLHATNPPADFDRFSAPIEEDIVVTTPATTQVSSAASEVTISSAAGVHHIRASRPGTYHVTIGQDARTEISFHRTVAETVRQRAAYILKHQRTPERPGLLAYGLVPVDVITGLTQTTNGWSDWTDGSERVGMALLLQQAVRRGLVAQGAYDDLLEGWSGFAQTHLLDTTFAPRRGSQDQHTGPRFYDAPWLAEFFHERFLTTENPLDLEIAQKILARSFDLGIGRFLAIGLSETCVSVAETLERTGKLAAAHELRSNVIASARTFIKAGRDLPGHEVAYEQSMVAPLVELMSDAWRLTGQHEFLDAARERLPWLLAFGGPQPHARLHGIAIRHWDGYWFGANRLWGDVFPHYWSALTAAAILRLPEPLHTPELDALAMTILRSNMANYFDDGTATCAFVMPTAVDGRPAHTADPLANDQDWHLAIWLRLDSTNSIPTS